MLLGIFCRDPPSNKLPIPFPYFTGFWWEWYGSRNNGPTIGRWNFAWYYDREIDCSVWRHSLGTWNIDFEALLKFVQLFPIVLILHDDVWGPISLECFICHSQYLYMPAMNLASQWWGLLTTPYERLAAGICTLHQHETILKLNQTPPTSTKAYRSSYVSAKFIYFTICSFLNPYPLKSVPRIQHHIFCMNV